MEEENQKLLNEFLDKMGMVKEEFIRLKKYEKVSVRKDIVKSELQDILNKSQSYKDLTNNLQTYINNLLKLEDTINE